MRYKKSDNTCTSGCKSCMYSVEIEGMGVPCGCAYLLCTGEPRGCTVKECIRYRKGRPLYHDLYRYRQEPYTMKGSNERMPKVKIETIKEVAKRYTDGETIHQIAVDYKTCDQTVANWLKKAGVKTRTRGVAKASKTVCETVPEAEVVEEVINTPIIPETGEVVKDNIESENAVETVEEVAEAVEEEPDTVYSGIPDAAKNALVDGYKLMLSRSHEITLKIRDLKFELAEIDSQLREYEVFMDSIGISYDYDEVEGYE